MYENFITQQFPSSSNTHCKWLEEKKWRVLSTHIAYTKASSVNEIAQRRYRKCRKRERQSRDRQNNSQLDWLFCDQKQHVGGQNVHIASPACVNEWSDASRRVVIFHRSMFCRLSHSSPHDVKCECYDRNRTKLREVLLTVNWVHQTAIAIGVRFINERKLLVFSNCFDCLRKQIISIY